MLPELQGVVRVIEQEGYKVDKTGFEVVTLSGDKYVTEAHGEYTSGIYTIYEGETDIGTIFEKNFLITKYYAGRQEHHTSLGMIFLDTRGGRKHTSLKQILGENYAIVCGTMPKEKDLEDGQGQFVDSSRIFNPFF